MKLSIMCLLFSFAITSLEMQSCSAQNVHPLNSPNECPQNPDKLYNQRLVLEKFSNSLNTSIPEYRNIYEEGFYINKEGRSVGFFIYDLTDTLNREATSEDCIKFYDNHIYHFCPIKYRYSFSHIAVLENGSINIFKSVNCINRGDKLDDLISYLNQKITNNPKKEEIITRVKNYRKYGYYSKTDEQSELKCDEKN